MLISIEEWVKLCRKPENNLPEKYIVCYFLGKIDRNYRKKIETFAKEKNLPIIKLLDITAPEYYSYDPAEVLYIIMHSKYVLTDSFHGTVFSILFHKQFYVFERTEGGASMNSRLETLIEKFGLEDCIHAMEKIHNISEEHWNRVDEILNVERKKTFLYIQKSIDNE
jgi:exopolysaccharide biosynthesis predicted pyruvyltransferase EpsI